MALATEKTATAISIATETPTEVLVEKFGAMMRGYRTDPVGFCDNILGVHLWSKQREIAEAVAHNKQVSVKSANTIGKTFLASCLVLWFLYTRCPSQVVTTAPTANQVEGQLWAEINTRYENASLKLGRCLTVKLVIDSDWRAVGYSTKKGGSVDSQTFQGYHSPNVMVIIDEANGVADQIFGATDAILSGGDTRLLLIGNPITPVGQFYDTFMKPELGFKTFTIATTDTPAFTGEKVLPKVLASLTGLDWPEKTAVKYGKDSPYYLARVLAQFPTGVSETVLAPTAWIEAAKQRGEAGVTQLRKEFGLFIQMGVDVGRGTARSGWAWRSGRMLGDIVEIPTADTGQLRLRVQAEASRLHVKYRLPVIVAVDEIGVGAGVVDNWEKQEGVTCVGINVGATSSRVDCTGLRDELHWRVRELLDDDNEQENMIWAVPEEHRAESDRAQSQFGSIRWELDGRGRIKIESKANMFKRNMPSPDEADMVTLSFADVKQPRPMQIASAMREKVFSR